MGCTSSKKTTHDFVTWDIQPDFDESKAAGDDNDAFSEAVVEFALR